MTDTYATETFTRVIAVATYPADHDRFPGLRVRIVRNHRGEWPWRPGATSSRKADAIQAAEDEGATISRETVTGTREVRTPTGMEMLRDLLKF